MTKLYKYQKAGVKRLKMFNGRALLADEMGLGKTLQVLTYLKLQPETLPAIVVCPATAKWVWKAEIRKHTKFKSGMIEGQKTRRIVRIPDIIIINYEILPYWKTLLRRIDYGILILDEVHYCKSWKAKRTRASISLGKKTEHIIAMSGTPLTNRPKELYTTLHLLLPNVFKTYVSYAFRYCGRRITPWGWDDNRATHLDELHNKLTKLCMIRRTKKQVLKDLPEKSRMVVALPLDRLKLYKSIELNFLDWLEGKSKTKAKKAKRAAALTKLVYLSRIAAILKFKSCKQWIDTLLEDTDDKVVVFAKHRKMINLLQDAYKRKCTVVDGRVKGQERQRRVDKFQNDKKTRLFIGQIKAAGTAITLTRASTVVFTELDWVPGHHLQAEDRVHRIGQNKRTFIYYLVAKETIEERLCKVLQRKFRVIQSVLDGESEEEDFNIFDELIKWYRRF
jgi:SWI/SNF-related matrix-associated actin-dependent regulator 1 of chromatin subfamily A